MTDPHEPVVLINLLEVPVGEDERFVPAWRRVRDELVQRDGHRATALHRSLGPADFRFVNIAHWQSPSDFRIATASIERTAVPFQAHPALYEVVQEDQGAEAADSVVLINPFEVPSEVSSDDFVSAWQQSRQFLADRSGYLGTQLHRSLSPSAEFRFVNVAQWRSADEFRAAIGDAGFRAASAATRYRAHPALYQVVHR